MIADGISVLCFYAEIGEAVGITSAIRNEWVTIFYFHVYSPLPFVVKTKNKIYHSYANVSLGRVVMSLT